jgi:hypothetical protein
MEKFNASLLEAGKTDISRRMSPPNQQDYRGCPGRPWKTQASCGTMA